MDCFWESIWLEIAVYVLLWFLLFGLLLLFMRGAQYTDDDANDSPQPTVKRDAGASVKTSIKPIAVFCMLSTIASRLNGIITHPFNSVLRFSRKFTRNDDEK